MDMFEHRQPTNPTPIDRLIAALRRMGEGFAVANRGEAGLRHLGLEALQLDREIYKIVRRTKIPDYPEE